MDRDINEEEGDTPAANADSRLKTITHYAVLAFAPVVSVAALVVAMFAVTGNQSQPERSQVSELIAKVDGLNASLTATKGELDSLKFAMSREKTMHGEERKKADELDAKIIQNVTRLQTKLKVAPTLEDQWREAASAPAVAPVVASAVSAPAAVPAAATAGTDKKPAAAAVSKGTEKTPVQAKALKDAIEKFNKK